MIEGLSMYKKWNCLDKVSSVENYMENVFSFVANDLQMASFFVHVENFNQQESMIFWQFASGADCVWIFMLVRFECIYSFGQNRIPARRINESRLNVFKLD